MSPSISTYAGWAGVTAVGVGYWYFQRNRNTKNKRARAGTGKQSGKSIEGRRDSKVGQKSDDGHTSDRAKAAKKKKVKTNNKPQQEATDIVPVSTTAASNYDDGDEELDNREFARQLQSAKSGTIQATQPLSASRQKSVKQSRANATISSSVNNDTSGVNVSASSDDNVSTSSSPDVKATQLKPMGSNDVSDMLEASAGGPSVLRITEPVNYQPKKEKKAAKAPEPVETKKQRQNRLKNEAQKIARAEEEQVRRILMEKQLRIAREAEGRAAKDGSTFMASKAPTSSAWTPPVASVSGETNGKSTFQPLDTFNTTSKAAPAVTKQASKDWQAAPLPTEEEQMKLLQEEDAWEAVTTKKGKKKTSEQTTAAGAAHDQKENLPAKSEKPAAGLAKPTFTSQTSYNVLKDEGSWASSTNTGSEDHAAEEDEWEVA